MKKLMMASVVAVSIVCSADAKLTKDSTEAEFRAVADAMLACTNGKEFARIERENNFWQSSIFVDVDSFLSEYDAKFERQFSGSPVEVYMPIWVLPKWPKVAEMGCRAKNVAEISPFLYNQAKILNTYLIPRYVASEGDISVTIGILSEMIANSEAYFDVHNSSTRMTHIEHIKKIVQSKMAKNIKKMLRRQGKSFVTKNGVSPVEQCMTRLTTALNAPRFAGLNEWLSEMGVGASVDVSSLPSDAEIATLKTVVLEGDKDLTDAVKLDLYLCLGVDAYNAFVKEYNGD